VSRKYFDSVLIGLT